MNGGLHLSVTDSSPHTNSVCVEINDTTFIESKPCQMCQSFHCTLNMLHFVLIDSTDFMFHIHTGLCM